MSDFARIDIIIHWLINSVGDTIDQKTFHFPDTHRVVIIRKGNTIGREGESDVSMTR